MGSDTSDSLRGSIEQIEEINEMLKIPARITEMQRILLELLQNKPGELDEADKTFMAAVAAEVRSAEETEKRKKANASQASQGVK